MLHEAIVPAISDGGQILIPERSTDTKAIEEVRDQVEAGILRLRVAATYPADEVDVCLFDPSPQELVGDLKLLGNLCEGLVRGTDEANGLGAELRRVRGVSSWHRPFLLGIYALKIQGLHFLDLFLTPTYDT